MHYFWNRGNGTLRDILSVVTLMRKFMFKKGGTSVPSFLVRAPWARSNG